jgi:Phosphotransferase enzyme family
MPEMDTEPALEVAKQLAGAPVELSRLSGGGRNSRIWRVRNGQEQFALKQYPARGDDPRDRLATEVGALRLMERCGVGPVPGVIGVDPERGYALLSWIEGSGVTQVGEADIDAAVTFLGAVHRLRSTPRAPEQPLASEACLSAGEIERQIGSRLQQLRRNASAEAELVEFFDTEFTPALREALAKAHDRAAAVGIDFGAEISREQRTLVPADFGFHNCLRRTDGSLAFVDFEYFGWDDPAKLTADIMLHPGRALEPPLRKRFRRGATQLYGSDYGFSERLSLYLPLFGLRWVLILLNEFIPERWQRRVLAGETRGWSEVKVQQLARAREFLESLPEKLEQ